MNRPEWLFAVLVFNSRKKSRVGIKDCRVSLVVKPFDDEFAHLPCAFQRVYIHLFVFGFKRIATEEGFNSIIIAGEPPRVDLEFFLARVLKFFQRVLGE